MVLPLILTPAALKVKVHVVAQSELLQRVVQEIKRLQPELNFLSITNGEIYNSKNRPEGREEQK